MPVNSYKVDEQSSETGKLKTLFRLLSYLAVCMSYKQDLFFSSYNTTYRKTIIIIHILSLISCQFDI